MNSPMAVDVARRVIARSEFQGASNDLRRIFSLYRIIFQRQPRPKEIEMGIAYVQGETKKQSDVDAMGAEIRKKNAVIQKRIDDLKKRENDAKKAIQNEGQIVERKPLTPWESYAHALLFANESAYVN
jgi:hypothetical protein